MAIKAKSRTVRWAEAASAAAAARDKVMESADELCTALQDLRSVQEEYEEWRDNLPENLQQSALGEKLEAVLDIDIESACEDPLNDWSAVEEAIDNAEGADLPLGFGRD